MLHLATGGNGTGKTLLTLKLVRELQLKENRPVYYNGRFRLYPKYQAEFNWQLIDFKDWQSVPDGAIFIIDEAHNDMPAKYTGPVPEPVRMLAEHRVRGFDFFLLTQHPNNIDPFVRRLISSPGWHRHLKRVSGAPLVSVLEWPSVNANCEKNGSGASAAVTMVSYPKEVYAWYESATIHTAKIKVPFQVKMLIGTLILFPIFGYYGYQTLMGQYKPKAPVDASGKPVTAAPVAAPAPEKKPMTAAEYVASFTPRVDGLQYTAPRFDELTKPTDAPFPAACVSTATRCQCYTQQATKLAVPKQLCEQFARDGYFRDWGTNVQGSSGASSPATSVKYDGLARSQPSQNAQSTQTMPDSGFALPLPSIRDKYSERYASAPSGAIYSHNLSESRVMAK